MMVSTTFHFSYDELFLEKSFPLTRFACEIIRGALCEYAFAQKDHPPFADVGFLRMNLGFPKDVQACDASIQKRTEGIAAILYSNNVVRKAPNYIYFLGDKLCSPCALKILDAISRFTPIPKLLCTYKKTIMDDQNNEVPCAK